MQLTTYTFIGEMRTGNYRDEHFSINEAATSPRDAVIELVAEYVESFAREENHGIAKIKADEFISQKLGTRNWTPKQFCDGWIELWSSEWQVIRVYDMEENGTIEILSKSQP